ncbi:sensor histidine kinase [Nonomuraea sp. 10N515B]|uniref:sensor histidine kinase n=1 Tax=Nonomuraea sp. 10N515B TaxID=3457422 RepID=UPI003FCD14E9
MLAAFGVMLARGRPLDEYYDLFLFHNGPSAIVLLWMGRLVLRRRPGHNAGRILLAIGIVHVLHVAVAIAADVPLVAAGFDPPLEQAAVLPPSALPLAAAVPLWIMNWLWVPAPVLAILLLVVFPDGRLPSRRWWPVPAAALAGAVLLLVGFVVDAWPTASWGMADVPAVVGLFVAGGGLLVAGATVACVAALVMRWRRAGTETRQPFRVVGVAAIVFAIVGVSSYPWQAIWVPAVLISFNGLLVAYGLAIARYRLHDLEPLLGRAAVATTLTVLIAAVYLAIVVGIGRLLGAGTGSTLLPLVAVAAVALLVEPVRRRTRRTVDRLLYGRYADRTEVLSRLAAHASAASAGEVLEEVTRLLVRSTGATRAEFRTAADPGGEQPTLRADVEHRGERFGELCLHATAPSDLVADAPQLLADVAHAVGVVLRNDQLAAQLQAQLAELRASRQRLVEAHDRARRTLERDIHDGAQVRLIALRMKVGAAAAQTSPPLLGALDEIGQEVDAAIRSLRNLAQGIFPPILEQAGIADALRAHVRELPLPVTVTATGVGRYPRTVESAVYFACLEALQNAIRHSRASDITVELLDDGQALAFAVHDDGIGFTPSTTAAGTGLVNISDRIAAIGGRTEIQSAPAAGTRVCGRVALQPSTADR